MSGYLCFGHTESFRPILNQRGERSIEEDGVNAEQSQCQVVLMFVELKLNLILHPADQIHIDEYNRNLIEILSIFQITYPKARILVLAPSIASFDAYKSFQLKSGIPDVDIQRADFDRSNDSAKIYRDACLATAASNGKVVVIDTLKLHQDAMERSQLGENDVVEDGVHFSGLGYQVSGSVIPCSQSRFHAE